MSWFSRTKESLEKRVGSGGGGLFGSVLGGIIGSLIPGVGTIIGMSLGGSTGSLIGGVVAQRQQAKEANKFAKAQDARISQLVGGQKKQEASYEAAQATEAMRLRQRALAASAPTAGRRSTILTSALGLPGGDFQRKSLLGV